MGRNRDQRRKATRTHDAAPARAPYSIVEAAAEAKRLDDAARRVRMPVEGAAPKAPVVTHDIGEAAGLEAPIQRTASGLALPTFDSFANFAQKIGFGTDNPLSSARYSLNPMTRNRTELEFAYRGNWVCGLAVDLPADDMTREGVDVTGSMAATDSARIEAISDAQNFWPNVADAIKWSRLYGGAIGVLMIDGQNPREPLRLDAIPADSYKGILVLDRWQVQPSLDDLVDDMGPDIGLPRYYRVNEMAPAMRGCSIHHSRVAFRLLGLPLPNYQKLTEQLWGLSVLERLEDRLKSFDSATMGAAQLVYKAWFRNMKVDGLREIVASGPTAAAGLAAYTDLVRRFQGIEGVTLLDAKDEMEVLQHGAFSGLADILIHFGQQISGALQIPLVRLFGQAPTGLNSSGDSDLATYYDSIAQQQARNLGRGVLLNNVLIAKSKRLQIPEDYGIKFRSLWKVRPSERPTVAKTVTETIVTALDAGLITQRTAVEELRQSSRETGIFTNITPEHIAAADDQLQPPLPPMEGGALPGMPGAGDVPPGAEDEGDAAPALEGGPESDNYKKVHVHMPNGKSVITHLHGQEKPGAQ